MVLFLLFSLSYTGKYEKTLMGSFEGWLVCALAPFYWTVRPILGVPSAISLTVLFLIAFRKEFTQSVHDLMFKQRNAQSKVESGNMPIEPMQEQNAENDVPQSGGLMAFLALVFSFGLIVLPFIANQDALIYIYAIVIVYFAAIYQVFKTLVAPYFLSIIPIALLNFGIWKFTESFPLLLFLQHTTVHLIFYLTLDDGHWEVRENHSGFILKSLRMISFWIAYFWVNWSVRPIQLIKKILLSIVRGGFPRLIGKIILVSWQSIKRINLDFLFVTLAAIGVLYWTQFGFSFEYEKVVPSIGMPRIAFPDYSSLPRLSPPRIFNDIQLCIQRILPILTPVVILQILICLFEIGKNLKVQYQTMGDSFKQSLKSRNEFLLLMPFVAVGAFGNFANLPQIGGFSLFFALTTCVLLAERKPYKWLLILIGFTIYVQLIFANLYKIEQGLSLIVWISGLVGMSMSLRYAIVNAPEPRTAAGN
ncbi:unnamed protein product, partial [Mesorhabditis belari]|uniref:Uncharacterized protein n=1 Tax=Mesorhabditis belari TaxID=2138241 RepID=A0AAF3EC64_9BILA